MARVGPAVNGVFTGSSVGVAGTKTARVGTRVAVMKFGCLVVSEDESTEMEIHEESRTVRRERIIIFLCIMYKEIAHRTASALRCMCRR
jgi:hypothetical protein